MLREWLDSHAMARGNDHWGFPAGTGDRLYIQLEIEAQLDDWEPPHPATIVETIGGETGLVIVDVSGRIPGDDEVREVTLALLARSPRARAQDDHSNHLWTRDEILSGATSEGHPFFDYRGWYEAGKSAG